jgi:hypothetical protein
VVEKQMPRGHDNKRGEGKATATAGLSASVGMTDFCWWDDWQRGRPVVEGLGLVVEGLGLGVEIRGGEADAQRA